MDEALWPARNVAEYAYCPRLFYLMEVEGIHLASVDTLKGIAVHRRVDKPSNDPDSSEEMDQDRPKTVRSLTLTDSALGLTATLDLAEINGNQAIPVEYRKGRPKYQSSNNDSDSDDIDYVHKTSCEPWPTDLVQIGLQAYLLKQAGYHVEEGIFYYASEKRRLKIPVTNDLIQNALETLQSARLAAKGQRPLPLVNDVRCIGCSLQPFCLPDEINSQRIDSINPRKIWPPRDDGIHIVAQQKGTKLGVRGHSIRVTESDGTVLTEMPIASLETLSLLGSVQISTQAVAVLAGAGVPIGYLSPVGRLIALVEPMDSVSAEIRRQQVRKLDQPGKALQLSQALLSAKILNQRTLLIRNHSSLNPSILNDLAGQAEKINLSHSLDSARGHEGQAASLYFGQFSGMFRNDALAARFKQNGRQRRPPPDPINSCLSMAYTMLTHECITALRLASLEPTIGALHVSRPGRPALALDLMEPFRPLIADSMTLSVFNRNELTAGHFIETAAGCLLSDAGRKAFFNAYGRRMDQEITHPVFGYRLSYRRMLVLHARMIAAWFMGEIPNLAFLTTR